MSTIHKTALAAAIQAALAAAFPALAQTTPAQLPPVTVTANGIPTSDSDATYASEVHDRKAIEASGLTTLFDYLSQYTSLNVTPAFGSKLSPLINLRGYGAETGYQNVAIVIDGLRVNSIDLNAPTFGAIALETVERIEIAKGSGSVAYGDGAMAGVINITTKARTGLATTMSVGNYGAQNATIAGGLSKELFDVSFNASNNRFGGTSERDPSGHRDESETRSEQARLTVRPLAGLSVFAQGDTLRSDIRYPNRLSLPQFNANPAQSDGTNYTHQTLESRSWKLGGEYRFNPSASVSYTRGGEDRDSIFTSYRYAYDASTDDVAFKYRSGAFALAVGLQRFDGKRISLSFAPVNATYKENLSNYIQGQYRINQLTLSAGVRREKVKYSYVPAAGTNLNSEHSLNAWDFGANYRLNDATSLFANLNHAYQAPDIDRFFDGAGGFNGFIAPAKVDTLTTGFNNDTARNKLRSAVFYSKLENEIYYDANFGNNTNLDKTHKYGLELQDTLQVSDSLQLHANYAYTRAVIDTATRSSGAYNNKELPGVPRHSLTLGAALQPWSGGTLNLNHIWRSTSYAISDFDNSHMRQPIYQSTNVSLRQRWGKVEGFLAVDNLFQRENGLSIYSPFSAGNQDFIYPYDFKRTARVGFRAEM